METGQNLGAVTPFAGTDGGPIVPRQGDPAEASRWPSRPVPSQQKECRRAAGTPTAVFGHGGTAAKLPSSRRPARTPVCTGGHDFADRAQGLAAVHGATAWFEPARGDIHGATTLYQRLAAMTADGRVVKHANGYCLPAQ